MIDPPSPGGPVREWRVWLDDRLLTTIEHLQADDAAIEACAAGERPGVRLWAPSDRCIVFPPSLRTRADDPRIIAWLRNAGWTATARRTGGGMVPLAPGMLNVSMIFTPDDLTDASLAAVFEAIGGPIRQALADLGLNTDYAPVPASFCDGRFNLAAGGRKLCGLSQWRGAARTGRRPVILAHAVVIVDDDPPRTAAVLNGAQAIAGDEARFDPASWASVGHVAGPAAAAALGERLAAAYGVLRG